MSCRKVKNFDPAFRLALRDQLFPYYAKASLLAKSYKNRFIWTGQLTYIFATSAVIVLLMNVIFGILPEWVYYIEFVLLFLILTLISIAHKRKVHTRWLEYRFLVERIRVAPYFFLAGRDVSGITPSSNSSGREKKGQWAVMAFAEIWHRLNMNAYKHNTSLKNEKPFNKELISFTRKSWIEGQLAFQNKYYKTNDRKNTFYEKGGRYNFMAALAIAFIHIVLSWFHGEHEKPDLFHKFLTIFALSLPTIAAAFEGIRRQNEYSRNKNRSEGMKANLESLKVKFNAAKEEEDFNKLMREADILMLSETQEWMMLMEPMELELKA